MGGTGTFGAIFEPNTASGCAPRAERFGFHVREIAQERPDALFGLRNPQTLVFRKPIVEFALKERLPAIYAIAEIVEAGGLMSYGPNRAELFKRAAAYVAKILKGAKPADLPIEQPTKFELMINLKTAKALDIEIPPNLLARADEVLE
jgi:putative tryptophan/tyrosine transport system substrate-binding protein